MAVFVPYEASLQIFASVYPGKHRGIDGIAGTLNVIAGVLGLLDSSVQCEGKVLLVINAAPSLVVPEESEPRAHCSESATIKIVKQRMGRARDTQAAIWTIRESARKHSIAHREVRLVS
eukprot:m.68887 g.68887  ORF g.68887 m.68887 type:complete len:119 (-) comp16014_c0_seq1:168-524(-)